MLTKNWYNHIMCLQTAKTIADGHLGADGNERNMYQQAPATGNFVRMAALSITGGYDSGGVRIGRGTTPPTLDDFELEDVISSGATVANPSAVLISSEDDGVCASATYTIQNSGEEDLNISEIGLFNTLYVASGSPVSAMIDRTVLDEPITIAPGQSKQLTYTIKFNYPTA